MIENQLVSGGGTTNQTQKAEADQVKQKWLMQSDIVLVRRLYESRAIEAQRIISPGLHVQPLMLDALH